MSTDFFRHAGDGFVPGEPFHYRRCGLDNIYLLNGYEEELEDGESYVSVLDVDGLHQAIGLHLVMYRKSLAPKEIRFLRRTLNLTQAEMGRMIGQSDQQIARWEKGENHINGPADRLLRLVFIYTLLRETDRPDVPASFLEKLAELDTFPEGKVEFCRDPDGDWKERQMADA